MKIGDEVQVKEGFDIPEFLRSNGPSEGVVVGLGENPHEVIVEVEDRSVPYWDHELEVITNVLR